MKKEMSRGIIKETDKRKERKMSRRMNNRRMNKTLAAAMAVMMVTAVPAFAEEMPAGSADGKTAETESSSETSSTMAEALSDKQMIGTAVVNEDAGSITVKGNKLQTLSGKTFTAYEMFELDYVNAGEDDNDPDDDYAYKLKSEWKDLFTKTLGLEIPAGETVDSVAYQHISEMGSDTEKINAFTKKAYDYAAEKKIEGKTGTLSGTSTYRIDGLEDGYYLVFETVTEENGTLSKGILSTVVVEIGALDEASRSNVKNVVVTQKADIPEHDKEIFHDDENSWGDVGDNAVGDIVNYRIITSIPDTFGYTEYAYVIHDFMEKGLTLNADSIRLYSDEEKTKEIDPNGYSVSLKDDLADGCDFEISVDRATLDSLYKEGMKNIYTYYDCVLNEEAEIAEEHNDNTSYLEYSCNPYVKESHAKTPEVTVYDYTFELDALKINAEGNALKDAKFQVMRDGKALNFLKDDKNNYYVEGTLDDEKIDGMEATDTIVTSADGKINLIGLNDAVEYTLHETVAPAGYTKADDVPFTITAEYDENTSLLSKTETNNRTIKINSHRLSAKIIDEAQPPLPVTGGRTTIVFYGAALAAAASGAGMIAAGKKKKEER